MSNNSTDILKQRLHDLGKNFTIVTAYLHCPEKEPTRFLELLEGLFQSEGNQTLLDDLATAWTAQVEQKPDLTTNPNAPHEFLCVIKSAGLFNATLSLAKNT